jgi:hypothetical protein
LFITSLSENLNQRFLVTSLNEAKTRAHVIRVLLSAWQSIATIENCRAAAAATGTMPFNPEIALSSRFLHSEDTMFSPTGRTNNQRNRRVINNLLLTKPDNILIIQNHQRSNPKLSDLNELPIGKSYSEIFRFYLSTSEEECKLLSHLPPFFQPTLILLFV